MVRRKKYIPHSHSRFVTEPQFQVGSRTVCEGDTIKIKGEHGRKFRVIGYTTNHSTGDSWVDCYELVKGVPASTRAFYTDRVKPMKKRRKRVKN